MKLVADAAIPHIEHWFAGLAGVRRLPAGAIDADAVRDADILIVRTATRVDRALLNGSRVALVATATSGTDHIDAEYLGGRGITLVSAAGCNARTVAEYVLSCLAVLAGERGQDLGRLRVGVIGCGHVGGTLLRMLRALGVECLPCDPPLQAGDPGGGYVSLEQALQADAVSLHVPLTGAGPHATRGMVGADFLQQLGPGAVLINAARGGIVDEPELIRYLRARPGVECVHDVWPGEPAINTDLLRRCRIGTPHIAGYSAEARRRATRMLFERIVKHLDLDRPGVDDPAEGPNHRRVISLPQQQPMQEALAMAILAGYDVRRDDERLRPILEVGVGDRAVWFDRLRRAYPLRREFPNALIQPAPGPGPLRTALEGLGFSLAETGAGR